MMYIAVYPVALSIRSTNVYEERSLGVFEAPEEDDDDEPDVVSTTLFHSPVSQRDVGCPHPYRPSASPLSNALELHRMTLFTGRSGHARTRTSRARRSVRRVALKEAGVRR